MSGSLTRPDLTVDNDDFICGGNGTHRLELLQLTKSLAWLDSEEAGLCEECGSEISLARLKVVPNSRLCITCAQ